MAFSLLNWKKREAVFAGTAVGVTLVVALVQLRLGEMKARDARRKADVQLVAKALTAYYDDHDIYPASQEGQIAACGYPAGEPCRWGEDGVSDEEGVVYIKKLPREPMAGFGRRYVYEAEESRQGFKIYVSLENRRDPEFKKDLTVGCGENVQCNWYAQN